MNTEPGKVACTNRNCGWIGTTDQLLRAPSPFDPDDEMTACPSCKDANSIEDQTRADERIPLLLKVPAAVRFLSCEPLLGPVDLGTHLRRGKNIHLALSVAGALHNRAFDGFSDRDGKPMPRAAAKAELERLQAAGVKLVPMAECEGFSTETGCPGHPSPGIDWVICGGESGPGARPMHPDWARSLRDQCAAARVPFLFKQWGEYFPAELLPDQGDRTPWRTSQDGHPSWMVAEHGKPRDELLRVVHKKVGKAAAGRLLDGRLHDEYPAPRVEVGR